MCGLRVYRVAPAVLGHEGYEGDREFCAAIRRREYHRGPRDPNWDLRSYATRNETARFGESGGADCPRLQRGRTRQRAPLSYQTQTVRQPDTLHLTETLPDSPIPVSSICVRRSSRFS